MTVERVVSIPSGVSVTMDGTVLHVKGPKGNLQRDMWYPGIEIPLALKMSGSPPNHKRRESLQV